MEDGSSARCRRERGKRHDGVQRYCQQSYRAPVRPLASCHGSICHVVLRQRAAGSSRQQQPAAGGFVVYAAWTHPTIFVSHQVVMTLLGSTMVVSFFLFAHSLTALGHSLHTSTLPREDERL